MGTEIQSMLGKHAITKLVDNPEGRMHEDRDPKHAGQTCHYKVSGQP